ncbi:hypothetical protein [Halalkalibacter alkalisediminis]|uniref:Transposase n=1 Tax=Halalkalibacter alkalisediminis TaxID=935616 RepID=A0ABV6NEN6_9BACI|nr:hypothetical protein [Halalkalibacter alkalisediminis]
MDLELIWEKFITLLKVEHQVNTISKKTFTGIPFLYITALNLQQQQLNDLLIQAASQAMKGKQLTCDITFVRMKSQTFVYRIRFKVPQEKLFCCGNGCSNCIRLKN